MTAVRVGIGFLVAFAVLSHGAVEVWSQSVLDIGAGVLLLWWGLFALRERRVEIHLNPLFLPLMGLGGIVLIQWLSGLSVYPYLTKVEFLKLAAYIVLVFLAVQSFRNSKQMRPLIWFLVIFGFAVALFGIVQFLTFNDKLYWLRPLRYGGSPFGPYVNRNHFAGLMELIIPLGLAILFYRAVRRDKLPLVGLFTIVPIGALFLSASRAGILSFCFQLGLLAYLVWARHSGRKQLPLATGVILLAGAFVVWLGVGPTWDRFTRLWGQDLSQERRVMMLEDSWRIFLDHPGAGTGAGTLVTVYPQYASFDDARLVDHAHNDYLELLAETGIVGGLCALGFVVLLFRRALTNLQSDQSAFILAARTGALVACSGLLLHSLVDFNLHIPANALLFALLAFLATSSLERQPTTSPR